MEKSLSAPLVEQAGFPVPHWVGTTASLIGQPDVGVLTMSGMA
ncbi:MULTISPECIES: hypothetical protein [unclassified Streptomyces]|nr:MULTISPECIES: hypothetical protein [unclassified Streptomyces]